MRITWILAASIALILWLSVGNGAQQASQAPELLTPEIPKQIQGVRVQKNWFRFLAHAGELIEVEANQEGYRAAAAFVVPGRGPWPGMCGKDELSQLNLYGASNGIAVFRILAEVTGQYLLRVDSVPTGIGPHSYTLTLRKARLAGEREHRIWAAESALAEANWLRDCGSMDGAGSDTALNRFLHAAKGFAALGFLDREAEALAGIAGTYIDQGYPQRALPLVSKMLEKAKGTALEPVVLSVISGIHHRMANRQESAKYRQLAITANEKWMIPPLMLSLSGNAASSQCELGEDQKAKQNFGLALEQARKSEDGVAEARLLLMRASCRMLGGTSMAAVNDLLHARRLGESYSAYSIQAEASFQLGALHQHNYEWSVAEEFLQWAEALFRASAQYDRLAEVLVRLGQVTRDPQRREAAVSKARSLMEQGVLTKSRFRILVEYDLAIQEYLARGDQKQALARFDELQRMAMGNSDPAGVALSQFWKAHVLGIAGRVEDALQELEKAGTGFAAVKDPSGQGAVAFLQGMLLESQAGRAVGERKLDLLRTAVQAHRKAVAAAEQERAAGVASNFRYSILLGYRDRFEHLIATLIQLGLKEESFEVAEAARARLLLDEMDPAFALELPCRVTDAGERESLTKLWNSRRAINRLLTTGVPLEQYKELLPKLADMEAKIDQTCPEWRQYQIPKVRRLKEVQSLLEQSGRDSRIVEYFFGQKRGWVWVVSRNSIEVASIPGKDAIQSLVTPLGNLIRQSEDKLKELERGQTTPALIKAWWLARQSTFQAKAAALSDAILKPIWSSLPQESRLLVVAEGPLLHLPFSMLPVPGAGNASPLVKRHEVIALPSASGLLMNRERHRRIKARKGSMITITNPEYPPKYPSLPPYLFTTMAKEVLSRFSAKVLQRGAATRLALHDPELETAAHVVFFLHAEIVPERMDHSALLMSYRDSKGQTHDPRVTLQDIFNLHLSAELVTLSSCSSALGRDRTMEGSIGFPRALLASGARRVLSPLWVIDAPASGIFLTAFYEKLSRHGMDVSTALRQTQLEMMDPAKSDYSMPFYWAAFGLYGDW